MIEKPSMVKKATRPPLGLMPRRFYIEARLIDVREAVWRYLEASRQVPMEWVEEYNELIKQTEG